ncbi:MAG: hypothetical protein M1834_001909 [Cirrosporium novae-zelandiae]|nr:MAG: hypothetical protein M1834_001909 [Cirrosporium novae-zelandiae]
MDYNFESILISPRAWSRRTSLWTRQFPSSNQKEDNDIGLFASEPSRTISKFEIEAAMDHLSPSSTSNPDPVEAQEQDLDEDDDYVLVPTNPELQSQKSSPNPPTTTQNISHTATASKSEPSSFLTIPTTTI